MLKTWNLMTVFAGVTLSGALACQPTEPTRQLKREILANYEAGTRDAGHRLLTRFDYANTWAAHEQATLTAVFDSRERGMTLYAERKPGVSSRGDMLIAVPPGTRFIPQSGQRCQELILARGAVILMGSLHSSETVTVPVFCSTYARKGPEAGVKYTLRMAQPSSPLDAIAQAVCSGKRAPQVSEACLAVWIASGSAPTPTNLATRSYLTFHAPRQAVNASHVAGAKRLLVRAGLDPRQFAFFGGQAPQGTTPTAAPQPGREGPTVEPQPAPAPAPSPTGATSS